MKFGRPVDHGDGNGKVRMIDVVELPQQLPSWGSTPEAFLTKMYENQRAAWMQASQWFVQVPDGVQPCAVHTGSDFEDPLSYSNPDGTAGDGLTQEQRDALNNPEA